MGGRFGLARALGVGMVLVWFGCFIRSLPDFEFHGWRLAGTILIGLGIALGNVLLPRLVKSRFPDRVGPLTSLYSTSMNLGAALGNAAAVPLADQLAGGWNASIATWGVVALATCVLWAPHMVPRPTSRRPPRPLAGVIALARQRRAWEIAIFTDLHSSVFYSAVAWIPAVLQMRGLSEVESAHWVTAMQILGCVASLVVPTLAGRARSQSGWIVATAILNAFCLAGVLFLPAEKVGFAVLGFGLWVNASFGLALLIIAMRSRDSETAASLSSLVQATGYLLAAPGPWFVGLLSGTTGGWTAGIGFVIVVALGTAVFGWQAGRSGELSMDESEA